MIQTMAAAEPLVWRTTQATTSDLQAANDPIRILIVEDQPSRVLVIPPLVSTKAPRHRGLMGPYFGAGNDYLGYGSKGLR